MQRRPSKTTMQKINSQKKLQLVNRKRFTDSTMLAGSIDEDTRSLLSDILIEIFTESYGFAKISDSTDRQSRIIYIDSSEEGLSYEVIAPDNDPKNIIKSTIAWHLLPDEFPKNSVEILESKDYQIVVLKHILKTGHIVADPDQKVNKKNLVKLLEKSNTYKERIAEPEESKKNRTCNIEIEKIISGNLSKLAEVFIKANEENIVVDADNFCDFLITSEIYKEIVNECEKMIFLQK